MLRRGRDSRGPALPTLAAAAVLAGWVVSVAPAPAAAQGGCSQELEPRDEVAAIPWAQRLFDFDRVRPLSRGDGVTVAVIDSGVDAGHPQLDDGQILAGADFTDEPSADGRLDCAGHGTGVASIIAASGAGGIGFRGLAPGATILPVRVSVRDVQADDPERTPIEVGALVEAVRFATDQGVQVINTSVEMYFGAEAICGAVADAVASGIVVVAAAGNTTAESDDQPDPIAYPAGCDGVVSVGAVDSSGQRLTETYVGPNVDLLAPGAEVTGAFPGGGHDDTLAGTSFATPFVSATAALVLARYPGIDAAEVTDLLRATADPAPGLASEPNLAGVVNPYRALTGRVADKAPVALPGPEEPEVDPVAQARAERWDSAVERAVLIMVFAVLLTGVGLAGAGVWRRGQRNRWLPARHREPEPPRTRVEDPQARFYTLPTPRSRR